VRLGFRQGRGPRKGRRTRAGGVGAATGTGTGRGQLREPRTQAHTLRRLHNTHTHLQNTHTHTHTTNHAQRDRALHGDIAQAAREATLAGFRDGRFNVLVATDVAARGLDISGVELVVQVRALCVLLRVRVRVCVCLCVCGGGD
jgi:hypothetical protein